MNIELPIVGVAMMVADLDRHHNWIIEGRRDLELQDFIDPAILDGDWRGYVERARHRLDGHDGRLGIHGPFYDLPLAASDPAIREVSATGSTRRWLPARRCRRRTSWSTAPILPGTTTTSTACRGSGSACSSSATSPWAPP